MDYKDYMDYNQRDYLFQMQQMQQMRQMPFSFMSPYPDLYMSEIETDRDLQYLQQMYPADARRMQKWVEEACDKLEYEGSMMYDEYPDRVTLLLICDKIADAMMKEDAENQAVKEAGEADAAGDMGRSVDSYMGVNEEMNAMQMRRPDYGPGSDRPPFGPDRRPERPAFDGGGRPERPPFEPDRRPGRPPQGRPTLDPGRRNLLEVLLYNEMYKRRSKRRRTRRFW